MSRSFKILFERERQFFSRLFSFLKKRKQKPGPSRRPAAGHPRPSIPIPGQEISFRRRYPRLTSLLAMSASVVFHLTIGLLLITWLFEKPAPPEQKEFFVSIRLAPKKLPPKKKPGETEKPQPIQKKEVVAKPAVKPVKPEPQKNHRLRKLSG